MSQKRRLLVVITAMAIGVVLGAATMVAAGNNGPVLGTGTNINRIKTAASDSGAVVANNSSDLPGARHRFQVTGQSLFVGRFTALTNCSGGPGRCIVHINIHDNNAGDALIGIMQPNANNTIAVAGTTGPEVRSIERSVTLPAGDYDFQVFIQAASDGGSTTFTLDNWHFTMERIV